MVFFSNFCSTSHPGGNQVDGLPPATSTAAVLVGLRLGPRRSGNLGGKSCIVSSLWLSVSSFAGLRISIYMLNLLWRSFSLCNNQKSSLKLMQVFQVVLSKSLIFVKFEILDFGGFTRARACSTSLSGGNLVDGLSWSC